MRLRFVRDLGLLALGCLLAGSQPAKAGPIFFQSDTPSPAGRLVNLYQTPTSTEPGGGDGTLGVSYAPWVTGPFTIWFSDVQTDVTLALVADPLQPGAPG